MPWFYFDLQHEGDMHVDDIGSELENIDEAFKQAIGLISRFVKDELVNSNPQQFIAIIRDGSNKAIYKATLSLFCERLY